MKPFIEFLNRNLKSQHLQNLIYLFQDISYGLREYFSQDSLQVLKQV